MRRFSRSHRRGCPGYAREAFDQAGMFELQYFTPGLFMPMNAGKKPEVVLVYTLTHQSGGVIDAFIGEPLILGNDLWYGRGGGGADGMGAPGMASKSMQAESRPTPLTPEELAEIEKTAKLISRDEAIAVVGRDRLARAGRPVR